MKNLVMKQIKARCFCFIMNLYIDYPIRKFEAFICFVIDFSIFGNELTKEA